MKIRLAIISAVLMASTTSASGQTKEETEAWIIAQTRPNVAGLEYSVENGELARLINFSTPLGTARSKHTIPIDKITHITLVHTERYLSYTLSCTEPCVDMISEGIDLPDGEEGKSRQFLFEIYRPLDTTFPPRMNKALLRLVELHGGKAKLSRQVLRPSREPF